MFAAKAQFGGLQTLALFLPLHIIKACFRLPSQIVAAYIAVLFESTQFKMLVCFAIERRANDTMRVF